MVEPSRVARHRARSWRRRVVIAVVVVLALALAAVTTGYGYFRLQYGRIRTIAAPSLRPVPRLGQPLNLLIIGTDSRAALSPGQAKEFGTAGQSPGQRNDVNMVLRIEPARHRVALLSIPRDLRAPIPRKGTGMFNEALGGGPDLVIQTIEQDLGIPIHHYVLVNFDGFRGIINALGGLKLYFPYPARDAFSGLDIPDPGCHHLTGDQALSVARSREYFYQRDGHWHADPTGDIGRIQRQQLFFRTVVSTAIAKGLANPLRANAFIGAVVHDITKDSALKPGEAVRLASQLHAINPATIPTYTVPVRYGTGSHPPIYLGDADKVSQTVAEFLGAPSPAPVAATGPAAITVIPATGVPARVATKAAADLRAAGFHAVAATTPAGRLATRVRYPAGHLAAAQALQHALAGTVLLRQDATLAGDTLVLVVGQGFRGLAHRATPPSTTLSPAPPKPSTSTPDYDPRPC